MAASDVILTPHTVDVEGGIVAGLLVRTKSRRDLGYIWRAGSVWRWRTVNNSSYGERYSQQAAVTVLRDIALVMTQPVPVVSSLPMKDQDILAMWRERAKGSSSTPRATAPPSTPRVVAKTTPPPATPARRIVWDTTNTNAHDLTAAIGAALKREQGK
jgi:hypothetical protein